MRRWLPCTQRWLQRTLWTPGSGYRPRSDDPHRRPTLQLREGAEAKVRRGYPWLPSKAVRNPEALQPFTPCLVNVEAAEGDVLGVALYSGLGSIAARMLCTTAYVRIDAAFFVGRLQKCLAYRERLFQEPFYRLSHGEADGLPGLIIDRYADHVVIAPAAGMDLLLWPLVDALEEVLKPKVVIIRQDTLGRRREGAVLRREVLSGRYVGPTELRENGVSFAVDLLGGQKTGWYFDQRDHRTLLASLVAQAPRVLDLYSYVGGFGVTLAHYGAEAVVCVDSSEAALELCRRSAAMNSVSPRVRQVQADAMKFLQERSGQKGETAGDDSEFDLVIVDPPNLGVDRMSAPKALRHYEKLLNSAALLCASPGWLFVASCTYSIGERELSGAASRALAWAQREYRLVATSRQAADHPGHLMLPESQYLKGELLVALAPQLEAPPFFTYAAHMSCARLSSDCFRATDLAKVCRAYSALRFHDAAHVSVLVACCKSTLSEASAADLSHLVVAAVAGGVEGAEGLIKEAALLATEQASFMLPYELGLTAITFGPTAADFLAKSPSSDLAAMEAAVASAELLHALGRAAGSAAHRLQANQALLVICHDDGRRLGIKRRFPYQPDKTALLVQVSAVLEGCTRLGGQWTPGRRHENSWRVHASYSPRGVIPCHTHTTNPMSIP
ncbi:rlmI [Symbiodinium natans]|uniref:RlmI protein n=1 Tax=Symbiodinium natans TaxID=878477 RepID=A0A812MYK2_9DINO|nr:rlmI [Symbiodinium natans]